MDDRDLCGRIGNVGVTNAVQPVITASRHRTKILFLPPSANRVTWNIENTFIDGQGIQLTNTVNAIEVVGDIARAAWNVIGNVAGPFNAAFIEYFAESGDIEDEKRKPIQKS